MQGVKLTQDSGLGYDAFGRITNLAPGGGAAALVNSFYTNDLVASQTQADQRQSWTLDPALRFRTYTSERFINNAWANAVTKRHHYGDNSDEPRWTVEDTTLPTNLTRNVSGPDGHLVATTSRSADITLQLTSLHGDVMGTVPITPTSTIQWGAVTLHSTDEFGIPQNTAAATSRYSWLGAHQRSQDTLADTILMGVRLYHPATGRFLSVDPIRGGSATDYDYANHDPINLLDLDGRAPQRSEGGARSGGGGSPSGQIRPASPSKNFRAPFRSTISYGNAAHSRFNALVRRRGGAPGRLIENRRLELRGVPDGFNSRGGPIELKPNNRRAIALGRSQLRRYERITGRPGELWVYRRTERGRFIFWRVQ